MKIVTSFVCAVAIAGCADSQSMRAGAAFASMSGVEASGKPFALLRFTLWLVAT